MLAALQLKYPGDAGFLLLIILFARSLLKQVEKKIRKQKYGVTSREQQGNETVGLFGIYFPNGMLIVLPISWGHNPVVVTASRPQVAFGCPRGPRGRETCLLPTRPRRPEGWQWWVGRSTSISLPPRCLGLLLDEGS